MSSEEVYIITGGHSTVAHNFQKVRQQGLSVFFKHTVKASIAVRRTSHSACLINKRYILASGSIGSKYSSVSGTCERYDIINDVWEVMPSLNICRGHHASCAIGFKVYAIGGAGEDWE